MYKKTIIIIFITLTFFLTMFIPSVVGAEGDVTLVTWEGYNFNEHEGVGAIYAEDVTIHRMAGDDFEIVNADYNGDGSKSLYLTQPGFGTDTGWINLTTDYGYITSISMYLRTHMRTGDGSDTDIIFYNDTIEVLSFKLEDLAGGDDDNFQYRDAAGVYHDLDATMDEDANDYILNITHSVGNTMIYNLTDVTNGASWESSDSSRSVFTWTSFDSIYITGGCHEGLWIDDIIINQETAASETGGDDDFPGLILDKPECGLIGCMPVMRYYEWFGNVRDTTETTHHWFYTSEIPHIIEIMQNKWRTTTIYYVDLFVSTQQYDLISSNGGDYSCRVNNNPFTFVSFIPKSIGSVSGYLMRFAGNAVLTDDAPLFCFKSSKSHVDSTYNTIHWYLGVLSSTCNYASYKHHTDGDFTDLQPDGVLFNNPSAEFEGWYIAQGHVSPYVQYWYDGGNMSSTVQPIPDIERDNFTLKYGDSAIEFKHLGYCDYGIGSHPTIRFHLNSTQVNLYDKYYYQVIKQSNEEVVMTGFIDFKSGQTNLWGDIYQQEKFTTMGVYYIALWNLTTNVQLDEIVMLSQDTVIVCQTGFVGLEDDDDDIDDSGTGSIDDAINSLPVYAKVIAALFIIILFTMSPYAIAVMISKTNLKVEIPSLLYVAFFFTGVIATIALGLLELYVFFIVLIGLIITFAILWLQGKKIGGEE